MNELANKIRALPVSLHRNERMVKLADVLSIVSEPEPATAVEAPSTETAEQEPANEPNPPKVARKRAEAGDR